MSVFQVIAILFALFMLYIINIHKRKAALSVAEVGFWYITWTLFIVIALFPNLLLGTVHTLRFARVFDLLTVTAFMFITTIVIYMYFKQKEQTKKIEDYIRKIALKGES